MDSLKCTFIINIKTTNLPIDIIFNFLIASWFQLGESYTLPEDNPNNNKTNELVAKLAVIVENASNDEKDSIYDYFVTFFRNATNSIKKSNDDMQSHETNWLESLDKYANEAKDKHIDIDSCLIGSEKMLLKPLETYSRTLFQCSNRLMNIAENHEENARSTVRVHY